MNKIFSKLNLYKIPEGLHDQIMKSIFFLKYATVFYTLVFILFLNFIVSLWFTLNEFIQNESIQAFKDMSLGFDWSLNAISDMFYTLNSTLSISTILICLTSAIFFGFISYITFMLRKISIHSSYNNVSGRIYD